MAADPQDPESAASGRRRRGSSREPPENSISVSRRARRPRPLPELTKDEASIRETPSVAAAQPSTPASKRPETDPWTVPERVRDRFIQEGNRFYFPDGHEAFRDRGRKLTTRSENTKVVNSLIEIALSRNWTEVSVSGTEVFRREAWQQARLAGLEVRGFRPSEAEREQLVRAIGRRREAVPEVADSVSAEPPRQPPSSPPEDRRRERIQGKLIEHGKDFYRHDPQEAPSYFVKLQTAEGLREVWGKDIERAVSRSLSQPKAGEEVVLQRTGREAVTVRRQVRGDQGELREAPVDTFRNRWLLETREFFDQRGAAAEVLRNTSMRPREAVRSHPELAGTYLNLRAAQIAARVFQDHQDQQRFVQQVRLALARDIERGEPLQTVRLRERSRARTSPERVREDLTR